MKEAEIWDRCKSLLEIFGIYQNMTDKEKLFLRKEICKCIRIVNGAKEDMTIHKN